MKKQLLLLLAFLPAFVFGQGSQNFEDQTELTGNYNDGEFTEDGITYKFYHCRNEGLGTSMDNSINNTKGIVLRRNNEPSRIEWTIPNGIGTLSFDARKAFTGGNNNRTLEVLVNGVSVWTSSTFGTADTDITVYPFSVTINEEGSTTVQIKIGSGAAGNRQVTIDNIVWTVSPSNANPTLNVTPLSLTIPSHVYTTPSASTSFVVDGTNLPANVVISSANSLEYSLDNATFSAGTLTLPIVSGTLASTTVYVRSVYTSAGDKTASIYVNSTLGVEKVIAVSVHVDDPCTLDPMNIPSSVTCHANGTPIDASDDYLTFQLNPLGVGLGTSYTVSVPSGATITPVSGTYGVATTFQLHNGSAGGGNVVVTITDDTDSGCTGNVTVTDIGSCVATVPTILVAPSTLSFGDVVFPGVSSEQSFTVEGGLLTEALLLTLTGTDFEMSQTSGNSFTATSTISFAQDNNGTVTEKTIYVRATPSGFGSVSGSIVATSAGADSKTVTLSATGVSPTPEITPTPTTMSGITNVAGSLSTSSETFAVSGSDLTADITVTAPANFVVSLTDIESAFASSVSIPFGSGSVSNVTVYVRSNATVVNNNLSGTITLSSTGAIDKTVTVSGTSTAPTPDIDVTPTTLVAFDHASGTASATQTLTVSGVNLTANITVTASANFELSLSNANDAVFSTSVPLTANSGSVSATPVYVRAKASSLGSPFTGTITASSTGATSIVVDVSGTAAITYTPRLITDINQIDADGVGIHNGEFVELNGVVHCSNFHATGYRFIIIDQTGKGIYVFAGGPKNSYFPPTHGDSLKLKGKIDQFNGLLQIAVDEVTVLKQDAQTVAPMVVTALGEDTESQYIQMKRVRIATPIDNFPTGNANIDITDGTNTFSMRIVESGDFANTPAPQGWFHITSAIGSQFKNATPYTDGYQILPCGKDAIENCTATNAPIDGPDSLEVDKTATFTSNGDVGAWYSSNPGVATIDPQTGVATGKAKGTIEIYHIVSICDVDTQKVQLTVTIPGEEPPKPPAGINENELAQYISVFPNPVDNQLTINHVGTTSVYFTISDLNGKTIVERTAVETVSSIDTQSWNKGVYLVHFNDEGNNRYVFKLVK